jgi:hypothetical protein
VANTEFAVFVDYVMFGVDGKRAWVEWFYDGNKNEVKDKVKELAKILDRYGFETWDNKLWYGYDVEHETIKKLVRELKRRGFKVKYKMYLD